MAVRWSASGQSYAGTTGLPASTTWSMTCWAKITTDRNQFSCIAGVYDGTGGVELATDTDGTTLRLFNLGTTLGSVALTVGAWYKIGVVISGTSGTLYVGPDGGALTPTSGTISAPPAPNNFTVGTSDAAGDFFNGSVTNVKMWQAALSSGEVATELAQYDVARTANNLRAHRFIVEEPGDYSGNGRTLTGGTGATHEAGPSITDPTGVFEDVSTPPVIRSSTGAQTSVVTASFTPPANSVIVVICAMALTSAGAAQPLGAFDSVGGAYAVAGHVDGEAVNAYGMGTIWYRDIQTSPGAMTVTCTRTGTSGVSLPVAVRVLRGVGQNPVGAVKTHFVSAAVNTGTSLDNLVTSKAGSMVYLLSCIGLNTPVYTPNAATVSLDYWQNASNAATTIIGKGMGLVGTPGSTSYGWTTPATNVLQVSYLAVEITPAVAAAEEASHTRALSLMRQR